MSFASETKSSLCNLSLTSRCCRRALLSGILCFSARRTSNTLYIATENASVCRITAKLIKNLFGVRPHIRIKKAHARLFVITLDNPTKILAALGLAGISMRIHPAVVKNDCCKSAFVRGAFLGGGSISSPQKSYHLEISTRHLMLRNDFQRLLSGFGVPCKTIMRNGYHVFYFKNSENISDMLALMGAHGAVMEFLNIKITKEMRNNANRLANCETANVGKTIDASVRQRMAINKINTTTGIDLLPPELQELAWLRLEHEEATLKELGEMMEPPLNKSAVNRRMQKILKISADMQ